MVVDMKAYIKKKDSRGMKQADTEDMLEELPNPISAVGVMKIAGHELMKAFLMYQSQNSMDQKDFIRTYTNLSGYICPECGSTAIGARSADFYPNGVPEYAIRQHPELEQYRNQPYTLKYEGDEIVECKDCGAVVELKGYALECALNAPQTVTEMLEREK